ncbi:hypothetical protein B0J13DRAFT_323336 [Dactylonectria estremocensis]|uniref:Uncharacterized protein n=1 Tax=Dactylonectria estremocensis TaxID=1079267 RepID=A0A9P9EW01_9HYPO|nr:hypothetical protein B0J13DRAFT_323336 [Dactylonectria estremocensis]
MQTKDTGTICVKKSLPQSHSSFIGLMLQRKLVLLYRRELVDELKNLNGMCRLAQDSPNGFLQRLCHRNDIDPANFSIVHEYDVSLGGDPIWWDSFTFQRNNELSNIDFVVVCGIPLKPNAPSEHILPWFALLSSESFSAPSRRIVSGLMGINREGSSPEVQRFVGDTIFEAYADHAGNILQVKLPTAVSFDGDNGEIFEIRVNRMGAGGSTFCADVEYRRLLSPSD